MLAQVDTKTVYTFMDSTLTIDRYVARGKELGYAYLGIMDHNNLYATYSFLEACYKAEVRPLLGCELDLEIQGNPVTIQVLALNSKGYQHLMKISTVRMMGEKDFESIRQYLSDVAVIVPVENMEVAGDLGVECYIGVRPDTPAQKFDKPILPLYTVRYLQEADLETIQVLHAIRDNQSLNQTGDIPAHQALLGPEEAAALFEKNHSQALKNLEELVAKIHYELDRDLKLPRFNRERPAGEELRERATAGLARRGLMTEVYQERLDKELSIIHQMGFDDYFLIVWDLLRFGRSQGYYMGMGRGSAVGSLVAYALDITGIDPVKHNLLFERFLNQERFSMPDIDIDIPDIYRGDFLRYVQKRYGSMHAAQIVTYSTFGARQAIRDVFKRFGTPEYELTNITKKISFRDSLASAYERNASLRQIINSKAEYQKAFTLAKAIEG